MPFEPPIRVGDVVAVDDQTDTVTKIQIRATTITNGDRQDFLVANNRLITGSLINWTLNAGLKRVTISIGVADGRDTDEAREILLDIASEHPHMLDKPAPTASSEEFGASSLNLVLRAHLANLDSRSSTINELYTAMNKRFASAGIEIANPLFDIRLHGEMQGS